MVCRVLNDTWRPAKVCVSEEEDAGASDDDETGSQMRKERNVIGSVGAVWLANRM